MWCWYVTCSIQKETMVLLTVRHDPKRFWRHFFEPGGCCFMAGTARESSGEGTLGKRVSGTLQGSNRKTWNIMELPVRLLKNMAFPCSIPDIFVVMCGRAFDGSRAPSVLLIPIRAFQHLDEVVAAKNWRWFNNTLFWLWWHRLLGQATKAAGAEFNELRRLLFSGWDGSKMLISDHFSTFWWWLDGFEISGSTVITCSKNYDFTAADGRGPSFAGAVVPRTLSWPMLARAIVGRYGKP